MSAFIAVMIVPYLLLSIAPALIGLVLVSTHPWLASACMLGSVVGHLCAYRFNAALLKRLERRELERLGIIHRAEYNAFLASLTPEGRAYLEEFGRRMAEVVTAIDPQGGRDD